MTGASANDERPCAGLEPASGSTGRRCAPLAALLLCSALILAGQPGLASNEEQAAPEHESRPDYGSDEGLPERPWLGWLTLGPRSYRESARQIGWMLSVGLATSIVTGPWYAGTVVFQGSEAAEEKLGSRIPGYPEYDSYARHHARAPHVEWGRYHALIIGIDHYEEQRDLVTAVSDANAVATLLREAYGFDVHELVDADRRTILRSLRAFRGRLGRKDNLLVYYAGHGYIDPNTDEGYWLPSTAGVDDPTDWLSNSDITTELKGIDAKHILVIADSCFSGSLNRQSWVSNRRNTNVMSLVRRRARLVMTSGGVEPVTDRGEDGHSVFASQLLDALRENQSFIEGSDLFSEVRRGVTAYSTQVPEYGPIQLIGHEGGDFIFVRDGRP